MSVILSVYNGGKYFRKSVARILNKTFIDFEYLVINDVSIDFSEAMILFQEREIKIICV